MPRRKHRLEAWLRLHPRTSLVIGIAALGAITVWEIIRIGAARHTVSGDWAAGLAVGVAAGLTMATVLAVGYRAIQRAPRKAGGRAWLLTLLIGISPGFAFLFTAPPPGPESQTSYLVTTTPAVAGMAYAATFFTFYLGLLARALPRVVGSPRHASTETDRHLLTALIGPREYGWDVSWIGDGRSPGRLRAATLTQITDQAAAAAIQHYLRRPARAADTDFQIALFPHDYIRGPIFDISGGPGAFTAIDKVTGRELQGAALEDLLAAADSASDLRAGEYMFRWIRPLTALSPAAAIGLEPAG